MAHSSDRKPRTPRQLRRRLRQAAVRRAWPVRPLVLALMGALPWTGQAAPAANQVPVPVFRNGVWGVVRGAATVHYSDPLQKNLLIDQTDRRAIYNWASFSIGRDASVTFNMAQPGSQALNRVVPDAANGNLVRPSEILGHLTATNGGEIFLINPQGILFGKGAQVNVGGLFASTLDVLDDDFMNGLTSISQAAPTFSWRYAGGTQLDDAAAVPLYNGDAYVTVEAGASITTPSGGRVFLLSPKTSNQGRIDTPQGQTVLASGGEVFLNSPLNGDTVLEPIYASENNPKIPALRGLLVEVSDGPTGARGQTTNAGTGTTAVTGADGQVAAQIENGIFTAGGNTTLVGYAVNQAGRISASTSVSRNGSVFLLARSDTQTTNLGDHALKHASTGGVLTVAGTSRIEMLADNEVGANGVAATSTDAAGFTASRIEMSGHTIDLQSGSQIKAPGAQLRARAEAVPNYSTVDGGPPGSVVKPASLSAGADPARAASARVTVASGAVIDVSGTTTAVVDGARNFVTTGVLGKNDLADAPAAKNNPVIYYQPVSFDIRRDVPIMATDGNYAKAVQRTAEERMATGGTVDLVSSGVVATSAGATIDVSGGQVNYTAANNVKLSKLVDSAGKSYSLNDAPADLNYTKLVTVLHSEQAYVDGRAAGRFNVTAATPLLAGTVRATTVVGQRQRLQLDPAAQRALLSVTALSSALQVGQTATDLNATDWARLQQPDLSAADRDALTLGFAPDRATLSAGLLGAGFGSINLVSDQGISLAAHSDLNLAPQTRLTLLSRGAQGIDLASSIHSAGGSVTLQAEAPGALSTTPGSDGNYHVDPSSLSGVPTAGVTLHDGVALDMAGQLVNLYRDGASVQNIGTQGGTVSISSQGDLVLGAGTAIDVSGGALVSRDGKTVSGGAAGSIALAVAADRPGHLVFGTPQSQPLLQGYALSQGGTLSISAHGVHVGAAPDAQSDLNLAGNFFSQGGFKSFDLNGQTQLTVADHTVIAPRQTTWQLPLYKALGAASGTRLAALADRVVLPDGVRHAVDLTLQAPSFVNGVGGNVVVGDGAVIDSDPLATINLLAENRLVLDGRIRDAGGTVNLTLQQSDLHATGATVDAMAAAEGLLWLGQGSVIDVSGLAVALPQTDARLRGKVLAGGAVNVSAPLSSSHGGFVWFAQGARINAQGAQGSFDMAVGTASGTTQTRRVTSYSDGGSIAITAPTGAVLEGQMQAQAGGAPAAGGRLTVAVNGSEANQIQGVAPDTFSLTLQNAAGHDSAQVGLSDTAQINAVKAARFGQAVLSTNQVDQGGFADVALSASDRFDVQPDAADGAAQIVTLGAARSIALSAPAYQVADHTTLDVNAPSVSFGNTSADLAVHGDSLRGQTPRAASAGTGTIELNGSGQVVLNGVTALQGVQDFKVSSAGDVVLTASQATPGTGTDKRPEGQLNALGNVTIKAAQVYTATDEKFSINTPTDSGVVTFARNGSTPVKPAKPLSAGSTLTVNAHQIVQGGVVRAPLGQISFNADQIQLLAGSETSVSGAGLLVPFGSTVNGNTWTYNGLSQTDATLNDQRTSLLEKQVTLNAPTGQVDVQAGARVDATAGGDVVAYEFVPGPGGSTDAFAGAAGGAFAIVPGLAANATGYAPIDRAILSQTDASGHTASITVGQQITFGAGGPVPAGTYTVLPARYALLPGGFLVKADGGAGRTGAVDLNAPAVKLADGASSVAGVVSYAGTSISDTLAHRFVVAPNSVSSQYSEIKSTTGNAYFAALDTKAQRTPRPLPQDAGTVSINTLQLALAANTLRFTQDGSQDGSQDGTLELAAQNIHVGDNLAAEANTLTLSAATLNSSGAGTVLLGATREPASNDQRTLDVKADSVVVDGSATALQGSDITLVANRRIELKDGAKIATATNKKPADTYAVSGDGASLRVSGDAAANVVRTGSSGTQGTLALGAVQLDAGSGAIVAEASQRNTIAEGAQFKTQALTIGGNIALGAVPAGGDQLAITPSLSQQINAAQRITLRSYNGLNVYADANASPVVLGGAGVQQLTLDTAAITAMSPTAATQLRIEAGQLALTNTTTSVAPTAQGGHGVLDLVANGSNGQSGDVIVGPGTVVTQGFGTTNVNAARSVVVAGTGGLSVGGDLNLTAASVTAQSGAVSRIESGGNVTIHSNGAANGATAGLGATLSVIAAQHIEQAGRIELPSGVLNLQAQGGDTVDAQGQRVAAIEFADGSHTSVAGQTLTLSGNTVNTFGGTLRAQADAGSIHQAQGATLDVSAPATGADAGQLSLSATQGAVDLQGRVVGTAGAGQQSGSIDIDAQQAVDLHQLSTALAAEGGRNFTQHIAVRNRAGSQTLQAGDTLTAHDIALVSDGNDGNAVGQGRLDIKGTLNADGASGGNITLAARHDLTVHQGALLSAQATVVGAAPTQHAGGTIALSSSEGSVALNGGTLNVGPAEGTAGDAGAAAVADHGGVVTLRAARVGGTDVKVAAIHSSIQGARSVQVEAAQVYQAGNGVVNTSVANADNATLRNAAAAIKQRLTSDPALSGVLQVRPGVEIQSSGDLTLSQAWNLGSNSGAGDPVNLTLRAAGNLNIAASLSAGFNGTAATSLAQTGPASDIRLVAGADLASANTLATQGSAGDVVIGQAGSSGTTFVRSTTGNIAVAAAHDVQLASDNAAIYTTGQPVAPNASYTALGTNSRTAPQAMYASVNMAVGNAYKALTGATSPFYAQGGSVSLAAGHDVAGTAAASDASTNPNAWWYVNDLVEAQQTSWWTRYDLFKQGIGALAGGNVNVQAGHNVSDLQLDAMSNGFQVGSAPALTYGGGSVAVTAGQDIVASNAIATGEAVRYQAGGSIGGASDADSTTVRASGPMIGLFNGRASIHATRDVQLSEVGNAMRLAQFLYRAPAGVSTTDQPALASQISKVTTRMFSQTAQVQIGSAGGDAGMVNSGFNTSYFQDFNKGGTYGSVSDNLAASFAISAPSGSINVGNLTQYLPTTGPSGIALLAGQNLTVNSIAQHGALAGGANDAASAGKLGLDATATKPRASVALVAEAGDLTVNSESYLAAPTQFAAGRDINLGAQATNGVSVQHQAANELTSIVAGRDVNLGQASNTNGGVKVSGPGDLLVVAGRDVNLGASPGILALGDNLNSALPSGSAQVSVLAGVNLKAGDFTQAAQAGYAVLGGQRLSAADLGTIENTVTQAYLHSQGKSSVSELDAAQSSALRSQVRTQQLSAALDRADALGLHFADQLVSFMQQQQPGAQSTASTTSTGSASTHEAQLAALLAFDQLSPERQALFMQKVLVAELRAAGRSAVGTSGAARDAAYAPGYASIEALFPGATARQRAAGDISMATSQIETVQNSGINLLTPGGGINAGQTASGSNAKPPDQLGIVTLAGGDINGVVNQDFLVNSSRVFTVGQGDMLLWSSQGNIDAGRGAKTVVGTPPPRYYVDSSGKLQVDTAASFSGSGIAVLNADSALDLYAPHGEINAGDAGIAVKGKGFIDARVVIGATNISGSNIAGVPAAAPVAFTPIAAPIDPNATSAGKAADAMASSDNGAKTRSIDLDFLGMGDDVAPAAGSDCTDASGAQVPCPADGKRPAH